MSAKNIVVLATIAVLYQTLCMGHELPPYIKPCRLNDPEINKCAVEHGRDAIPYVIKGDPKYRAPTLDPITLPEVKIEHGMGAVGLTMIFKNVSIMGLKDVKIQNIDLNLKERKIYSSFWVSRLEAMSKYDISGRILFLPIEGRGDCNVTLLDNTMNHTFTYDLIKKADGLEYMNITHIGFDFALEGAHYHLTNLFNGNKFLGDNMNIFLNENWREVADELSPTITESITQIMRNISARISQNVPYKYIFI